MATSISRGPNGAVPYNRSDLNLDVNYSDRTVMNVDICKQLPKNRKMQPVPQSQQQAGNCSSSEEPM